MTKRNESAFELMQKISVGYLWPTVLGIGGLAAFLSRKGKDKFKEESSAMTSFALRAKQLKDAADLIP